MLFDQRARILHDFGPSPHNFISFNPQGRLIALAGFGNLAGKIEIFDRRTLAKVSTIEAPNTSYCEWSPDGRFLLTATLSPRLRVDNGIKIWHCTGPLVHVQLTDELYQTGWRPTPIDNVPQFGQNIPPAPPPSESVKALAAVQKPTPSKPAGAYRPPGARGLATPSIFKREDEGGPMSNGGVSGSATPPRYNRSPVPGAPGYGQQPNGHPNGNGNGYHNGGGRRQVPGAPPSGSPSPAPDGAKGQRRKKGKKDGPSGPPTPGEEAVDGAPIGNGGQGPPPQGQGRQGQGHPGQGQGQQGQGQGYQGQGHQGRRQGQDREQVQGNRSGGKRANGPAGLVNIPPPVIVSPPAPEEIATPVTPGADSSLDPVAKKARNLNKKVCFRILR